MASKRKTGPEPERVRRRRSPEQAREEILAAAARLFLEHGPDQVGLVDVAREAGVSHALVSHYFKTFEGLVEAVVHQHMGGQAAAMLERLAAAEVLETRELLREVFALHDNPLFVRVGLWVLLLNRAERWELSGPPDDLVLRAGELVGRHFARVNEARGLPPPSPDQVQYVITLVAVTSHGYALSKHALRDKQGHPASPHQDEAFLEQLARMLEAYLADAVRSQPGSTPA
jgi:TetR/AcrR family transcriptional regulator, repressor for neighboring sulfatase